MNAHELVRLIAQSILGHALFSKDPMGVARRWDQKTPYGIHPVWCALTVLTETKLPEELRVRLAQAMLFHDFKKDTKTGLPLRLVSGVTELVDGMTFLGSDDEMVQVWERGPEVILGKLYDKLSNLLDGDWMTPEKHEQCRVYVQKLIEKVEATYGTLNIVRLARAYVEAK